MISSTVIQYKHEAHAEQSARISVDFLLFDAPCYSMNGLFAVAWYNTAFQPIVRHSVIRIKWKFAVFFWSATGTYTKKIVQAYKQNGHPYKMIRRRNNVHSPLSERCGGSATVIYCSGCCSLSSVESKTLESYSYVECSEFIWNRTNSHALKRAHTAHQTKPNRWKLIHKYSVAVWVFISLTRIVLLFGWFFLKTVCSIDWFAQRTLYTELSVLQSEHLLEWSNNCDKFFYVKKNNDIFFVIFFLSHNHDQKLCDLRKKRIFYWKRGDLINLCTGEYKNEVFS